MGDVDQAIEWYLQLLGLVPTDPVILQKMGTLFDDEGDKQQAYQYHFDSYRYFPSNLEVIDWLGSYFIEMQVSANLFAITKYSYCISHTSTCTYSSPWILGFWI